MDELLSVSENGSSTVPSVPWTLQDVVLGLFSFVGWILVVLTGSQLSSLVGLPLDPSAVIVFGTALLLLPAWYLSIHKYGTSWSDLGLRGFRPAVLGLGCGLMLLSLVFNMAYAAFLAIFDLQIQPDIAVMFDSTEFPLALLLGGALVAPFVEEIFFRGFVFAGLRQHWGWKKAAFVSATLFAIAHILPTSFLPILILGLIFALLYHVSGSIWPAILMHMLTNTVALTAAYAIAQGWIPTP